MCNKGGIMRLIIASVCCMSILMYSGYDFLSGAEGFAENAKTDYNDGYFEPLFSVGYTENEDTAVTDNNDENAVENEKNQSSEAVSAGSQGTVLGAVNERFISPYTANTSYNGIYLKNSTNLDIDLKYFFESPLPYKIEKNDQPQVLIMHTHTTESFLRETRDYYTDADPARTTDNQYNMVRLGAVIADKLNSEGIKTLHDTTAHDYPSYNGSYTRSAETVRSYLKKYPSIKVVIDLHRDAISGNASDKVKPVTEINGKKAAQVMIVMGSQSGSVTNHKNWQENLKLAVKLQYKLEKMYPSLARSLSLVSKIYNQNLTTGSILIEMGTEANSMEEVLYSSSLVASALSEVLK